ncbi:MAG: DUF4331 domain-containing protein [Pyrinomonadaceae bacterium]
MNYNFTKQIAKSLAVMAWIVSMYVFPALASSHAEAPLISMDRYADNTDVYAFRSVAAGRTGFVTLIANFVPFEDPSSGPQFNRFDDTVLYEIHIDNTGDGRPDISYQFRFTTSTVNSNTILGHTAITLGNPSSDGVVSTTRDIDYNMPQTYSITRVNSTNGNPVSSTVLLPSGPVRTPPSNVGPRVIPNYQTLEANETHTITPSGFRTFAGQRDEGFLVDVGAAFDLLNFRSLNSQCGGVSTTDGFNVNSIAIEVPIQELTRDGQPVANSLAANAVIGVYSTASRQSTQVIAADGTRSNSGPFIQVSRLGNPLINEVIIPLGLKDAFNSIRPSVDGTIPAVVSAVLDPELAKLLVAVGAVPSTPPAPRNDIAQITVLGIPVNGVTGPNYTTVIQGNDGVPHEEMRLNMGIAPTAYGSASFSRLGILGGDPAGYPNGRRVEDDVTDISLRVVAGGTPFTPSHNSPPNNTLGDGVSGNDVSINPITGVPTAGGYDYLQRFPYLAPPQQGNQPRRSNLRTCSVASAK